MNTEQENHNNIFECASYIRIYESRKIDYIEKLEQVKNKLIKRKDLKDVKSKIRVIEAEGLKLSIKTNVLCECYRCCNHCEELNNFEKAISDCSTKLELTEFYLCEFYKSWNYYMFDKQFEMMNAPITYSGAYDFKK